jgi:starch-binding outer membrane protein, SusD/RagB family
MISKFKKMKKVFLYIIPLLLLISGACRKNFLTLSPPTQENAATFYTTANDFQEALVGVYQALRGWADPASWLMGEERTDNTRYDPNPADRGIAITDRENVADWLDVSTNSVTNAKYINDYTGIERANIILDRITAANIDSADKKSVIGETSVLRAFFYFDLVQFYGAVPLNLHTVSSPDQAFLPRTAADSVYATIISDLQTAIANLPATVTFPQTGRVSIGTAKTLLANVYMVQKNWAAAQSLLTDVTQLGYALNPSYSSAFLTTNKNSVESIFEVQYQQGSSNGQYSDFIYEFIPPVANSTVITGADGNTLNYACAQNAPTQDLINAYESADTARLHASIGVIEGHYDANANFVADTLKNVGDPIAPGETAFYFANKYLHPHAVAFQTDDDWPIYRYAEVLLSLAECLNEQGNSGQALPWLNQVRARAGLAPSMETDQTNLRTVIAHERRIELALENKRWTDLLRTGQVIPVMTAFAAEAKTNPQVPSAAYNITNDKLLFPIPLSELQVNPLLMQNSGY